MDIANRLQELTNEILDFGDVISCTENPADTDFRNACDLFSQYMAHQLGIINTRLCIRDINADTKVSTEHLAQLSELITPANTDEDMHAWTNKLLDFCSQIQTLKSAAA